MQDPNAFPLPYILRDMLRFEYGTKFALNVSYRAFGTDSFNVVGATREGIFKYTVAPTADTSTHQLKFNIPDLPIWISVVDKLGQIVRGELYVNVALEINDDKIHVLTAGYVYSTQALSWPASNIETPEIIKGGILGKNSANPAAGAQITQSVPAGESWRIISCRFSLTTAVAVANRRVHLVFEIAGSPAFECIAAIDQIAGQTKTYTAMACGSSAPVSDDNDIIIPIPENIIIPADDIFYTQTTDMQAGDDFGIMKTVYERYAVLGEPQ